MRTVIHHPQGYGVGNVGQVASRTGVEIKAGESNYTEMGAEMGVGGALAWIAWNLTLLAALFLAVRRSADPARRHFAALCTAFLAAALALSVQTDVIGDPWMAYVVWGLAGLALASRAENGRQKTARVRAQPGVTSR
jgi:O-antigen ligase